MELLDALLTPEARKSVSGKTGIAVDTLLEYVRLCDLLRIRGVGPKMARLISLCGVTGTAALGKEVAAPLLEKMKEKNKVNLVSELLPQVETVEDWIQQARELPVVVKER
jgi:predicted flap endonuclease-1-like 5' DNA nuclease